MRKIDRMAESIMEFEGWKPGSRSYRHSNPGNLRKSKFECDNRDGYAVFETFSDGWAGLIYDISCKATGRTSTSLTAHSTVREFFDVYAPSGDSNHPAEYCKFVCDRAGISAGDELWTLLEDTYSPCN